MDYFIGAIGGEIMGDKYNVVDLGNIGEPAAGIVNNFMDKISGALGWMVTPKDIKPAIIESNKSLIEEISKRQDINPIERAAIISNYKKIIKEYKTQTDIMRIAVEHLKPGFKPEEVNNDWITFFFDKVKDVTEDYMKEIFGKILAGEFNNPNTYTKQLLHAMSIIDSKIATSFQKLRKCCFCISSEWYVFIYNRSYEDNIDNGRQYERLNINYADIKELDNMGFVKYRHSNFFTIRSNHIEVCYGNKTIELSQENNRIVTGNVSLTNMGKQLCNLIPVEIDENVLDICLDIWRNFGYNPIVKDT